MRWFDHQAQEQPLEETKVTSDYENNLKNQSMKVSQYHNIVLAYNLHMVYLTLILKKMMKKGKKTSISTSVAEDKEALMASRLGVFPPGRNFILNVTNMKLYC